MMKNETANFIYTWKALVTRHYNAIIGKPPPTHTREILLYTSENLYLLFFFGYTTRK